VAYDGTAYCGFQRQRDGTATVQGALEEALATIAGQPVRLLAAGRTDTGVHATGQVIAFDLHWSHGGDALVRALNANVPADIAIVDAAACAADFHPRFAARRRTYVYTIDNRPVRHPLRRRYSWHVRAVLDEMRMNEVAAQLVGVHDFATFGQPPQGDNTVREVFAARWQRHGLELSFQIVANAFLYRMVRSIVGSLKAVGDGQWSVAEFAAALQAADRSRAAQTAPPQGLVLTGIEYNE
jgi:tRNA pseudouridine38-40 synthase